MTYFGQNADSLKTHSHTKLHDGRSPGIQDLTLILKMKLSHWSMKCRSKKTIFGLDADRLPKRHSHIKIHDGKTPGT